ncbi:MAG: serine acetyltransferase [Clostridia bacterium]|nr:serine acetyltransferase [Clostridia bacterium]
MGIKSFLIDVWEEKIIEGTNRKALKRIIKANKMYHQGNFLSKFIAMKIHNSNIKKYGCEVYPQATIGEGLYIPHCVGITVGSTTVLGKNCTIFPNVVFGAKYSPSEKNPNGRRHAKCGDNCVFGANSTILGDITIGNNVTVGAGAVVTKDLPDGVTVVGNNKIIY